MSRIASRASKLPLNPHRALIAKADELARKGVEVYNYTAGQPGLPPSKEALEYFFEMVKRDPFKHFKYIPTQGLLELREAVSQDLKKYGGIDVPASDILITTGGAEALTIAYYTLLDPGESVLLLDPTYSVYLDLAKFTDVKAETCLQHAERGFNPDPECVKNKLEKSKAIIIASPDNPTSRLISDEVVKTAIDVAYEKKKWIIYDVAYKHLVYEGEHVWIEKKAPDMSQIIVVGSFSKDIAIPGGRLGYIYGASDAVKEMVKIKGLFGIVAPVPIQWLAYYYLAEGFKEKYLREVIPVYKRRRDSGYEALVANLKEAKVQKPAAGMYFFPDIRPYLEKHRLDDLSFAMQLAEKKGVVVLPGSIFGEGGKGYLRITFVTMDESKFRRGIELMGEFLEKGA